MTVKSEVRAVGVTIKLYVLPPSKETRSEGTAVDETSKSVGTAAVAPLAALTPMVQLMGVKNRAGLILEQESCEDVVGFP
jgi:hypothetical protein